MLAYIVLIGVPLVWHILCSLSNIKKKTVKNFSIILFFLIFILMLGCRGMEVGTDTDNYLFYYELINKASFGDIFKVTTTLSSSMEHGFVLLMKLFCLIHAPFNLFLLFCALVSLAPLMVLFYRKSDNPLLVILLFACVSPFTLFFSGIRQTMSMGIGVVVLYFAYKRKLFPFCLALIVAFFIHKSSIVLLILYPLFRIKISAKHLPQILLLCLVIVFLGGYILQIITPFLGDYSKYRIMPTGAYRMILLLLIFSFFCLIVADENKATPFFYGIRNILCLCLVLQCFSRNSFVATRVMYYFGIFVPLSIDKTISLAKKDYMSISNYASALMTAFFLIYFFVDTFFGNDGLNIFPYTPFWD